MMNQLLLAVALLGILSPVPALSWPTWLAQWWYGGPPTNPPSQFTTQSQLQLGPQERIITPAMGWKAFAAGQDTTSFFSSQENPSKSWRPIGSRFFPPAETNPVNRMAPTLPGNVSPHFFEIIHFTKSILRVTTPKPFVTNCISTDKTADNYLVHIFNRPLQPIQQGWKPQLASPQSETKISTTTQIPVVKNSSISLKELIMTPQGIKETTFVDFMTTPMWGELEHSTQIGVFNSLETTDQTKTNYHPAIPSQSQEITSTFTNMNIKEELSYRTESEPIPETETHASPSAIKSGHPLAILTKSISVARTYPDRFMKSGVRYGFGFQFPSHMRPLDYGTTSTITSSEVYEAKSGNFSTRNIRFENGFKPMHFFRKPFPNNRRYDTKIND